MSDTARELRPRRPRSENVSAEKTPPLVWQKPSPIVLPEALPRPNLSTTVATQLLDLMQQVTKTEVTPETVNAACNCAKEIHKIIRLSLEFK